MEENNMWGFDDVTLAVANIKGSSNYPRINGRVVFKKKGNGVLVTAEIMDLPFSDEKSNNRVFGFHIHEGDSCTGNENDPFADTGGHYNPEKCEHPHHAGDLPPLFENNGYAYMSVYTDRFMLNEIIGKTIVIHDMPDDFKTQPSGDSGNKIACGKIMLM